MSRIVGREGRLLSLTVIAIGLGATGLGIARFGGDNEPGPNPSRPPGEFSMMLKVGSADVDLADIGLADIEYCADGRPVPMPHTWEQISDVPIENTDGSGKTFAGVKELEKLQSQGLYLGISYRPVPETLCRRFAIDLTEMAKSALWLTASSTAATESPDNSP